jgi:hypothetical protein
MTSAYNGIRAGRGNAAERVSIFSNIPQSAFLLDAPPGCAERGGCPESGEGSEWGEAKRKQT